MECIRSSQIKRLKAAWAIVFFTLVLPYAHSASTDKSVSKSLSNSSVETLIDMLHSNAKNLGYQRLVATRELLQRGKSILPALKLAGAKPMATTRPSRLDVIYTLIEGIEPGAYRQDSLGIHFEPTLSREGLVDMGRRQGFVVPENSIHQKTESPMVYVTLNPRMRLEDVMRNILIEEPTVTTLNLNYFRSSAH